VSEAKGTDWEAIEQAYRAGQLSVRAIGELHGVGESTIRKRATTHGWMRDLTEKVQVATREKLTRDTPVRSAGAQCAVVRTDEEIVEAASNVGASIVFAHREGLAHWRAISNRLCAFLASADINEDNHGDIARSLNAGVDAQIKVIKAERQAYNLDEVSSEESFEERLVRLVGDSQ